MGGGGTRNLITSYIERKNREKEYHFLKFGHYKAQETQDDKEDVVGLTTQQDSKSCHCCNQSTQLSGVCSQSANNTRKKYGQRKLITVFAFLCIAFGFLLAMTFTMGLLTDSKTATGTISFTLPQGSGVGFDAESPKLYIGTSAQNVYLNGEKLSSTTSKSYVLRCEKSGKYLGLQFDLPEDYDCTLPSGALSLNGLSWTLSYNSTTKTLFAFTSSATTNSIYKVSLDAFLSLLNTTITPTTIVDKIVAENKKKCEYTLEYPLMTKEIIVKAFVSDSMITDSTTLSTADVDVVLNCIPKILSGAGTKNSPYLIATNNDFSSFMYTAKYYAGANFLLQNDLNFVGNYTFTRDDVSWEDDFTSDVVDEDLTNCIKISNGTNFFYIPPFENGALIFWCGLAYDEEAKYVDWETDGDNYFSLDTYEDTMMPDYDTDGKIFDMFVSQFYAVNNFQGTFDGGGHSLTGLFPYSVFLNCKNARISNLTVNGCAGPAGIAMNTDNVVIDNCVNNAIVRPLHFQTGGAQGETCLQLVDGLTELFDICGICWNSNTNTNTTISNCVNNAVLYGNLTGVPYVMNAIGVATTITGCTNNARIKSTADSYKMSGIGQAENIEYCVNYGNFEIYYNGDNCIVSGISSGEGGNTYYCVNYGDIHFGDENYGTVNTDSEPRVNISGIAQKGTVENCYSTMEYKSLYINNSDRKKGIAPVFYMRKSVSHISGITQYGTAKCCYYKKPYFSAVDTIDNVQLVYSSGITMSTYQSNTDFSALVITFDVTGHNTITTITCYDGAIENSTEVKQLYKNKSSIEKAMAQYAIDKGR